MKSCQCPNIIASLNLVPELLILSTTCPLSYQYIYLWLLYFPKSTIFCPPLIDFLQAQKNHMKFIYSSNSWKIKPHPTVLYYPKQSYDVNLIPITSIRQKYFILPSKGNVVRVHFPCWSQFYIMQHRIMRFM